MRKLVISTGLAVGLAALFAAPTAALAGTCTDALASNSFDCSHVNELDNPFTSCMKFTTPGVAGEIDLIMNDGTIWDGACSCSAKGSPTSPTFDEGSSFECVLNAGANYLALGGKASTGKIKKGHGTSGTGFSSVFTCVQRETPCP